MSQSHTKKKGQNNNSLCPILSLSPSFNPSVFSLSQKLSHFLCFAFSCGMIVSHV